MRVHWLLPVTGWSSFLVQIWHHANTLKLAHACSNVDTPMTTAPPTKTGCGKFPLHNQHWLQLVVGHGQMDWKSNAGIVCETHMVIRRATKFCRCIVVVNVNPCGRRRGSHTRRSPNCFSTWPFCIGVFLPFQFPLGCGPLIKFSSVLAAQLLQFWCCGTNMILEQ